MTPGQVKYFYLVDAAAGSAVSPPSATVSFVFPACQMPGYLTTMFSGGAQGAHLRELGEPLRSCSAGAFQSYAVQRWDVNAAYPERPVEHHRHPHRS